MSRHYYECLKHLLNQNSRLLDTLSELEEELRYQACGEEEPRRQIGCLLSETLLLAENLNILTRRKYAALHRAHHRIAEEIRAHLASAGPARPGPLSYRLDQVVTEQAELVGGKAANLGQIKSLFPELVPDGFVITTGAYRQVIRENHLLPRIKAYLADLDVAADRLRFSDRTQMARDALEHAIIPEPVRAEVLARAQELAPDPQRKWAVRSSAVGEDCVHTFAGLYETVLHVPSGDLVDAYRAVIVSRFAERAVRYRLMWGMTEQQSPMAVLFIPMIDARCAGVLYTRNPREVSSQSMVISSVHGLADKLVSGRAPAETFLVSRTAPRRIEPTEEAIGTIPDGARTDGRHSSIDTSEIEKLAEQALRVEQQMGYPLDVEWIIDRQGRLWFVQARPCVTGAGQPGADTGEIDVPAFVSGGITVCAGRAAGKVHVAHTSEKLTAVPASAILVTPVADPRIGAVLPLVAGLITRHGTQTGHVSTLARELRVPYVYGMKEAFEKLDTGMQIGLDATGRQVFRDVSWPTSKDRIESHTRQSRPRESADLLHERVFRLHLTDPLAFGFRPSKCRSVHDIIRFVHEKAVAALFDLGDRGAAGFDQQARRLKTKQHLNLYVYDLGGALSKDASGQEILPGQVLSTPFQALWRGISHDQISWAGRSAVSMKGFAAVVSTTMTTGAGDTRALGERNYLMVAPEYLNLNARLAYHFAMIDTWVGTSHTNNYVNFRFRGGGADQNRRCLRARFLAEVLVRSNFTVNRSGDLVTAWLRRHSREDSEDALALLGKLMGCARQLDMLMGSEAAMTEFVNHFLQGNYKAFC